MILETDRLALLRIQPGDGTFVHRLMNSPGWIQHIGDRGIRTLEDAETHIRDPLLRYYTDHGYGLYKMVLKSPQVPIGLCGFLKRDFLPSPDIGFAVLPAYEGKGYTYEAARALMVWGATHLGFDELYGITSPHNETSQHLLAKLGMDYLHDYENASMGTLAVFLTKSLIPPTDTRP
ncbi:MAG: GNAT family N-acetyltransferase [Cyclobacteriaceae bacterium]|nr:GNAT family N-acetyltransferase [Cyclobacteriaceae bacterium]